MPRLQARSQLPPPQPPRHVTLQWQGRRVARPLHLPARQAAVYANWLSILGEAGVPFVVGGAYALYASTGAWRDSKDLDVIVQPRYLKPALEALRAAGFETEVTDRLWLAKVRSGRYYADLIFAARHATSLAVTASWMTSGVPAELLGVPAGLLAVEELIVMKVYLAARERFDGADIVHLILAARGELDWRRIVDLLRGDDEIVFWHLVLFQIVYPGHASYLPTELMEVALRRLRAVWPPPEEGRPHEVSPELEHRFRGLLLDSRAFAVDVDKWGYADDREQTPLVDEQGCVL
jgi:hypothetical protein